MVGHCGKNKKEKEVCGFGVACGLVPYNIGHYHIDHNVVVVDIFYVVEDNSFDGYVGCVDYCCVLFVSRMTVLNFCLLCGIYNLYKGLRYDDDFDYG